MYIYIYICIYIYIYTHLYTCIHIYIYIYIQDIRFKKRLLRADVLLSRMGSDVKMRCVLSKLGSGRCAVIVRCFMLFCLSGETQSDDMRGSLTNRKFRI